MKRIAIAVFALCFVAVPARADVIKALSGTIGMGGISTAICVLTAMYASDEEDASGEDFDRRGFFIGLGWTFAGENFSDKPVRDIVDFLGAGTSASSDDSWSVKGFGGYRCHPRFSVGGTFEYFGGFDTDWAGASGTGSDDIDVLAGTVDVKGYLLTERYQPYLLVGGGTMHIDTSPSNAGVIQARDYTDFVFRLGGGLDVYATENVVVNIGASYLFAIGEVTGVDMYTIGGGLEYRF